MCAKCARDECLCTNSRAQNRKCDDDDDDASTEHARKSKTKDTRAVAPFFRYRNQSADCVSFCWLLKSTTYVEVNYIK